MIKSGRMTIGGAQHRFTNPTVLVRRENSDVRGQNINALTKLALIPVFAIMHKNSKATHKSWAEPWTFV